MASPPNSLNRSTGGRSGSSVKKEPFDHLIQHLKQYDPMLYEAFKRVSGLEETVTSIVEGNPFVLEEHKEIRAILPGPQVVATDVMDNRYRVTIDNDKKIKLSRCAATVKTSNPTTADYIADILRSRDKSASFVSLFPSGNPSKIIIKQNTHEGDTKIFAITELFNGDELRCDVIQTGSANGVELALQGKIVSI